MTLSCADKAMAEVFGAHYVSLHVRVTNQAAYHLYRETLGYEYAAICLLLLAMQSCTNKKKPVCQCGPLQLIAVADALCQQRTPVLLKP